MGQCSVCTVIIDGVATRSCINARLSGAWRSHDARGPHEERETASAATSVDRRAGRAMWLLPERPDHDGQGAARQKPEPERCRDPRGNGRRAVSMHDLLSGAGGDPSRGTRSKDCRRSQMSNILQFPKAVEDAILGLNQSSRRSFLKASGALVVSLSIGSLPGARAFAQGAAAAAPAGPYPRSRLPAGRHVDRESSRQHRKRSTSARPMAARHGHGLPPDDVR